MDKITFRCTACKASLTVGADKAGRSAKCTKCGTALTIPAAGQPAPVAAAAPAPKKPAQELVEEKETFDIQDAPSPEQETKRREALEKVPTIKKGPGRVAVKKLAKITDPVEWRKVGFGMKFIAAGLCVWVAAYLIYRIPLVVGLIAGPEFAVAADEGRLVDSPIDGQPPSLNLCRYAVALVAGADAADIMIWVIRVAFVLYLLQYAPLLAGYFICLAVPPRFGTRLQLMVLFVLAFFNVLFLISFRLLPMCGVYSYVILPFAMPEMVMGDLNSERLETVFTIWLRWPFVEAFGALLMTVLHYMEPAIIATFIHAVGKGIKSEELEAQGLTVMMFGYSQMFIQMVWLMACLCGASNVLLWALRFVYVIGVGFFLYQMNSTIRVLFSVSGVVEEQLGDEGAAPTSRGQDEEDDEDYEDDEEDEDDDEEDE